MAVWSGDDLPDHDLVQTSWAGHAPLRELDLLSGLLVKQNSEETLAMLLEKLAACRDPPVAVVFQKCRYFVRVAADQVLQPRLGDGNEILPVKLFL